MLLVTSLSTLQNLSPIFSSPVLSETHQLRPSQELLVQGCQYQERQGWERPGWFSPEDQPAPALKYDWYGAYDHSRNEDDSYGDNLRKEYSFEFPPHHDVVSSAAGLRSIYCAS